MFELMQWLREPLAIESGWLETYLLSVRQAGSGESAAGQTPPKAARNASSVPGVVAVVGIRGPLVNHESILTTDYGFVSYDWINQTLATLAADRSVRAIVLDFDSPGGSVLGCDECAARIHQIAKTKDVRAVANHWMMSAAYYLGSQAREVVVAPSGMAGSIGTITYHVDDSEMWSKFGVKWTTITAGKYKAEGDGPLTDEARARLQAIVDQCYDQFAAAVARGRGVRAETVKSGFGQGRYLTAAETIAERVADRIGTLEETIRRAAGRVQNSGARARMLDLAEREDR